MHFITFSTAALSFIFLLPDASSLLLLLLLQQETVFVVCHLFSISSRVSPDVSGMKMN